MSHEGEVWFQLFKKKNGEWVNGEMAHLVVSWQGADITNAAWIIFACERVALIGTGRLLKTGDRGLKQCKQCMRFIRKIETGIDGAEQP